MQLKVILDGLAGQVSDKQAEILSRASEKINALIAMSGELLDLSKIESGLIHMERQVLSLQPLLEDQVSFFQARARAKEIQLTLDMETALPDVNANQTNMEEVISNLVSNALNYTPEKGKITVGAGVQDDHIRVSVSDTGIGIAPEDMELIFNRFYRVKNADTRHIIGTGLGLPIVRSIVDAHHGRIQVESQVGKGSTFTIFLPLAEA
jgi:signal transduction histidine kinase